MIKIDFFVNICNRSDTVAIGNIGNMVSWVKYVKIVNKNIRVNMVISLLVESSILLHIIYCYMFPYLSKN